MITVTPQQHEAALKARVRSAWAVVVGAILVAPQFIGYITPTINPLLPPKWQHVLATTAIIAGLLAGWFSRNSGPSTIPTEDAKKASGGNQ